MQGLRTSRVNLALIVDEYSSLKGLVTLSDVLASIVGGPVGTKAEVEREIMQGVDKVLVRQVPEPPAGQRSPNGEA